MTTTLEAPSTARRSEPESALLEVQNLAVTFYTPRGTVRAVRDASLTVRRGEVVGVVGESGCGKSTLAFATVGYLPGTAEVTGDIRFAGRDITTLSEAELQDLRGNRVAMVYQDPATSLNPVMKIGPQIEEVLKEHLGGTDEELHARAVELFESVKLADPEGIGNRYPHELSGGMQQRVVIAMALACDPDLLVMDEPTTGLDVTTEATILDLVSDLKDRVNAGILFVTHNLGVVARVADRVVVMYAGQTVEQADVRTLFADPRHPYTGGLLSCVPKPVEPGEAKPKLLSIPGSVYPAEADEVDSCLFASRCPLAEEQCVERAPAFDEHNSTTPYGSHQARCFFTDRAGSHVWESSEALEDRADSPEEPLLRVEGLRQFYGTNKKKFIIFGEEIEKPVRAVVDVNLEVRPGRTLGIVGESGSGKSTMARSLIGLIERSGGKVELDGEELAADVSERTEEQRAALRMVYQNPTASLNPRLPIRHALERSLRRFGGLDGEEAAERAAQLLEAVGLERWYLNRHPGELSGGEQQRVALAGAFAANPRLIFADEAVSALDVSVQAQVLALLAEQQRDEGTAYVFISHDLGVVRYISDDVLVMYAGHTAEFGTTEAVLNSPSHPYTEALLSAAPTPDPEAIPNDIRLDGAVPSLREPFKGCFFEGRCPRKIGDICEQTPPPAQDDPAAPGHVIHCHIPLDDLMVMQSADRVGQPAN